MQECISRCTEYGGHDYMYLCALDSVHGMSPMRPWKKFTAITGIQVPLFSGMFT